MGSINPLRTLFAAHTLLNSTFSTRTYYLKHFNTIHKSDQVFPEGMAPSERQGTKILDSANPYFQPYPNMRKATLPTLLRVAGRYPRSWR